MRCLLSEARKLKSLVIDEQQGLSRDAEWFELVKLTCEQVEKLLASFTACIANYNASLAPEQTQLDASAVALSTRAYLTSIKRSLKANLVLFSDQARVQKDLDALSAALKALIQIVAANQAALSSDSDSDSADSSSSSSESESESEDPLERASRRPQPSLPVKKPTRTRRSRADSPGVRAIDAALSMLDEPLNDTDVLSSALPLPEQKRDVVLAVRLADSSFQTLLRFNVQATVAEALVQVRASLIRVGQLDEADGTVYALWRTQSSNDRRLEPQSAPLSTFGFVNRDVVTYKAFEPPTLRQHELVLIGADVGRAMTMADVDHRVHGLPRRLLRPKRQLLCQATFVRPADRKRSSLLLLFSDLLLVAKPKSSVARLVDRVRAVVDSRSSVHDDNVAAASPKSPVLAPSARKGASYHSALSGSGSGDDDFFEYVASFELQFLHIREQASCTEDLPHSFAVFGTSRFDNPPTTASAGGGGGCGGNDPLLEQLPFLALQFSNSSERIGFLAELRKAIRVNRLHVDVDGDFGEPTAALSPRRSVFARRAAPAPTSPETSQRRPKSPEPVSVAPEVSGGGSSSSSVGNGGGSLRRRAVAQSPVPTFANKPPITDVRDVLPLIKQVLVAVKGVRTTWGPTSPATDERSLLRVQLCELDDMCARLDPTLAPPVRHVHDAVSDFLRAADDANTTEPQITAKFHAVVEKAKSAINAT
jgi:hypothetical protein